MYLPTTARRAAPVALALAPLLVFLPSRARATPSTSATADAWSSQQALNDTSTIHAAITFQGAGGFAAGNATAALGVTGGWCTMSACAIVLPPPGQVCNIGSGNSSFNDQVTAVSDAPDGTPITVHVTFQCGGRLDGTGAYSYGSDCVVFNTGVPGANGSSSGTIATVSNMPISSSGSVDFGWSTGSGTFPVGASSAVSVADRCCFGGAEESWSMTLSLQTAVTMTVLSLPPGATYVHFIGSSGHDYGQTVAGVGGGLSTPEGLSAARPNPTPGAFRLDLTLARARSVDVGVFDLAGRRVATLAHGVLEPGTHALVWDGRDARGAIAHAGMYLVRARGDGFETTRRLLRIP